jgi:hypothetical protein
LSGWPSVTDSEVKRNSLIGADTTESPFESFEKPN